VVFQFAATVVLLAGAGLMIRNFIAVQQVNPFVPAKEILGARILLPDRKGDRYESPEARKEMHRKLLARLSALPGVDQAVLTSDFPGLGSQTRDMEIEGRKNPDPKQPYRLAVNFSSPGYLPAINLPILTGRGLTETDGETGKEAAVVTREFATRYWPGESPIGHRFRMTGWGEKQPGPWVTVVGVCGDIIQNTQDRHAPPLAYLSNRQEPWAWLGLMLRTKGDPAAMTKALRSAVQELDPDLPLFEVRTLPEAIAHDSWFLAVFGTLFFTFALIALLMASVGIYAVVAQNTARRTREIGIRMALGATAARVVRLMLARGLRQLGIGLVIGLAGAFAATRLMDSLLGLVSPTDPVVFGTITVLLSGIGLFACWLPARRAARVAPTEALRSE
jgi:predicted permease